MTWGWEGSKSQEKRLMSFMEHPYLSIIKCAIFYVELSLKGQGSISQTYVTNIYVFGGSSRLESLLITCDCLFLNRPKNLGQNHRQSICLSGYKIKVISCIQIERN